MDEEKEADYICKLLNWEDYRTLLKSNLHCYFSRPYVLSWSFIESAACCANIATNKMGGMIEVVEDGSVHWVDVDNPTRLAQSLRKSVKIKKKAKLKQKFSLESYLLEWQNTINALILNHK